MRTRFLTLIAGFLFASILLGCGGSSSSGQPVSTGVYKDAGVVSGLKYSTPSQSGVTDSNGKFKYVPGETVTFSVSNVTIGQATGAPIVTTFDLVGIAPPTSSFGIPTNNPTSKKFQEAINISLFLQTLDDDSDPTSGIAIPAVVNTVVAVTPINFKSTPSILGSELGTAFRDSPQFKVFIGSCRTAGAWGGTKAITQLGYSANSLYQGLGIVPSVYLESQTKYADGLVVNFEYTNSGLVSKKTFSYNDTPPHYITTSTYDKNGNLVKVVNAIPTNPEPSSTLNYLYDANGNLVLLTIASANSSAETAFEYDINGNKLLEVEKINGIINRRSVRTYNANGTLATLKNYDSNNQLQNTDIYKYNERLLLTNYQSTEISNSYEVTLNYDDRDNLLKYNLWDGTSNFAATFMYDLLGNLLTYSEYLDNSLSYKRVTNWDSTGYPVKTDYYNYDDVIYLSTVATYDNNGSRTRVMFESDGITTTNTSTFIRQSGWGDMINSLVGFFGVG